MNRVKDFFAILKLELADIEADLAALIQLSQLKQHDGQLTEYVGRLNIATFNREILALKDLVNELDQACCQDYDSLQDAILDMEARLPARLADSNYPEVVSQLVLRKIHKVSRYVLQAE